MIKKLNKAETDEILAIQEKDITSSLLKRLFANTRKGRRFNPSDTFILPKGIMKVEKDTETTVGRYIFNRFIIEPFMINYMPYVNEPVTGDKLTDIESRMSECLMDDLITTKQYIDYINRVSWLGYAPNDYLTPSVSLATIKPVDSVMKRKEELVRKHKEELDAGDEVVGAKIEKELIDLAKKELDGHPSMDLFNSGAKGSFGNNYKNTSLMRGPVKNSSTNKWNITTSDYIDGIKKDEYDSFGDLIVSSVFPGAVGTRKSGYETKRLFAAFQSVTLGSENSDCKTNKTLRTLIRKKNKKLFLYRYILEGGKYKLLTNENIGNYVDKYVQLRSPLFCQGEKVCSKCAGEFYYKLGITNVGLTTTKMSGTLLNKSLKKKHDTTIKVSKLDYKKYME